MVVSTAVLVACGGADPRRFDWDVVVAPGDDGDPSFQCTADGWAAGPPQACLEDSCADRAALIVLCKDRFADEARTLERHRERMGQTDLLDP